VEGFSPVISCLTAVTSERLRTCEVEGTRGRGVGESFTLLASAGGPPALVELSRQQYKLEAGM